MTYLVTACDIEEMWLKEVCIYHIAEIYLYEYYLQPGEYRVVSPEPLNALLEKGKAEEKRGGFVGAAQDYEKALEWNPVRTETYFCLIRNLFRLRRFDEMHAYTEKVFPFVCTKAELAQYYRWLGCWYLETYQPEVSECVYRYSTFFGESRQAEEEIRYLEAALGKKMPSRSVGELQKRLMEENIPVHASNVTSALLVRAGQEAERNFREIRAAEREVAGAKIIEERNPEGKNVSAKTFGEKNPEGNNVALKIFEEKVSEEKESDEYLEKSDIEPSGAEVWRQQAADCYRMAYDLTEDPEIKNDLLHMGVDL